MYELKKISVFAKVYLSYPYLGIIDPESCRLCQEDEESSYHVIAECPALQAYRGKIFQLSNPTTLPDPPVWSVMQISKFLRESPVGDMLDGNEYV